MGEIDENAMRRRSLAPYRGRIRLKGNRQSPLKTMGDDAMMRTRYARLKT